MKLSKIFVIALACLSMASCSDDDDPVLNTASGVTVSLENSFTYPDRTPATSDTLFVDENVGVFNLPIIVSGVSNGTIIVNVEVAEGTPDPSIRLDAAKEIENYVITSKRIIIPAGESVGNVEINAIWPQGVIDNDRTFSVKITSVEGAAVGNASTVVTIRNIDSAYTMMLGNWTFTGNDYDGLPVTYSLTFDTPDPSEPEYGSVLYGIGMLGYNFVYVPIDFEYDYDTEKVNLSIPTSVQASTGLVNFGSYTGLFATASSVPLWGDAIELTLSDDYTEITANPTDELYMITVDSSTGSARGVFDKFSNMKFTR